MAGPQTLSLGAAFTVELHRGLESLQNATRGGADSESPDVFSTRAWFETLSRFGIEPSTEVLLASVTRRDGGPEVYLPLQFKRSSPSAVFGGATESLSNYYSSLYAPIGPDTAYDAEAFVAVFRRLSASGVNCNVVDLHPLDADGAFHRGARAALTQLGYWTDSYFCFGNWYLEVGGRSFEPYLQSLPSRLRNTIRRSRKKLDLSGPWAFELHTDAGPELDRAISDFQAIYAQSWKQPEPFPAFVGALCNMAARLGWLRLGVLSVAGKPAAAQIWLHRQGRSLIFKLAHDEQFKHLSAGSVLMAELMRHSIDNDKAIEVDFLTGDDSYKADWMSHRRERVGLLGFRRASPQGMASALRHFAGRWWRAHVSKAAADHPKRVLDEPADPQALQGEEK